MSKADLHRLVDELPAETEAEAARVLQCLRDGEPIVEYTADTAPFDDEPLTPEDIAALEEAHEDIRAGREISHEEARRLLLGG